jgi:hypothetical protein
MLFFAALLFKSAFPASLNRTPSPQRTDFEQRDRGEHKDTEKAENGFEQKERSKQGAH